MGHSVSGRAAVQTPSLLSTKTIRHCSFSTVNLTMKTGFQPLRDFSVIHPVAFTSSAKPFNVTRSVPAMRRSVSDSLA